MCLSVTKCLYIEENQEDILFCPSLIGKNKHHTYIPHYNTPIQWQFRRTILYIKITEGEYGKKGL